MNESRTSRSNGDHFRKHRLLVAEDDRVSVAPEVGTGEFDLVISDVRMQGSTGLQVFAQMAGAPKIPPFIFITAFGSEDLHAEAEQLGAVAVLDKPVDFDVLLTFINNFLATASA